MATSPIKVSIDRSTFTKVVDNQTNYLIQNVFCKRIEIIAKDSDSLPAITESGFIIEQYDSLNNTATKSFPYVYARPIDDAGENVFLVVSSS